MSTKTNWAIGELGRIQRELENIRRHLAIPYFDVNEEADSLLVDASKGIEKILHALAKDL